MYRVKIKNESVEFICKQDTINYLYQSMQIVNCISKEVCIAIHTEEYTLCVWVVDVDKILLFFKPLDNREDCKISCSGKREDMNSPTFELEDNGYGLNWCSKYNLISVQQAIKEIEHIINAKDIVLTGNWYSW